MHFTAGLAKLVSRFRYPVSLPEDVDRDLGLGMSLPNKLNFKEFLHILSSPDHRPAKLRKFMLRDRAEEVFQSALKKETFKSCSLYSYYFNKGWLVFALHFDDEGRLRRIHTQCPSCSLMEGFDLPIEEEMPYSLTSSL